MERVSRSTHRPVTVAEAWAQATTPEGINGELMPLLSMTMPARLRGRDLDEFPVGTPAGRSWIKLFGLIPIDYDDLCLVELQPPRRFLERSSTLSFSLWEHERLIEPDGDGCVVTDRLGFELRRTLSWIPGAGRLARLFVSGLFAHRHRSLRKRDTSGR